jgi:hypothetical protein
MQAPNTTLFSATHAEKDHKESGHALYQVVTVLAILAFLISFWSC